MAASSAPVGVADPELAERLASVQARIADAMRASGRVDGSVTTIVVTKFHPASLIEDLHGLGVRDVGENRHQEAQRKATDLAHLGLNWHFIGQLQSKKARQVRAYATAIHSVDRGVLVPLLDSGDDVRDVFVQVDLSGDPGRGGVDPDGLLPLVEQIAGAALLRLRGVMAVAPLGVEPRPAFERLRGYSEQVRTIVPTADSISAGMSHDFAEAIAEGATHLRIGSAITGNRPSPP
ncbi:YggS family pyridoxal phosphate-dependent enzyme [Microbacteriaceae bacterium VKM Ac-2855]|nr:YggS family pyridoxal phosphate-dependent enzyme [Microbacteriaceae bacterium VKM Ac-2855]